MKSAATILGTGVLCIALTSSILSAQRPAPTRTGTAVKQGKQPGPPAASHAPAPQDHNAVIKRYCVGCHNEKRKDNSGGLTLDGFDVAKSAEVAPVAEK